MGFTITLVDERKKFVRIKFVGSKSQALPLYFSMFDRTLEYLRKNPTTIYPIGARLQPPYPKESIEGEIWKDPKPYSSEYKSSPHVLDILVHAGLAKYAYTRSRDSGRKVQGAQYNSESTPLNLSTPPEPASVDEKEAYLKPRREAILKWAEENMEDLTRHRLNYSWKNIGRKECERLRNEVSGKIIQSRIRNNGAVDLETLNAVINWGFGRDYPINDPQRALEVSGKAFEYLDKNDIKNATMVLLKEKGVGISRASKIIGLSDQENLCIYDSRVGFALQRLTHDGERLVKIPPSQSRLGDGGVTNTEWVKNYEHLIWISELIRDFMNENGCTYRIADVEMALFMMGK